MINSLSLSLLAVWTGAGSCRNREICFCLLETNDFSGSVERAAMLVKDSIPPSLLVLGAASHSFFPLPLTVSSKKTYSPNI
jgi:hypothetical protein